MELKASSRRTIHSNWNCGKNPINGIERSAAELYKVNNVSIFVAIPSENNPSAYVIVKSIDVYYYDKPTGIAPAYISVYNFKVSDVGYGGIGFPTHNPFIVVNNTVFLLFTHNNYVYYTYSRDLKTWSTPTVLAVCMYCVDTAEPSDYEVTMDESMIHVVPVNKTDCIVVMVHDMGRIYVPYGGNLTVMLLRFNYPTMSLDLLASAYYDLWSILVSGQTMSGAVLVNGTLFIALSDGWDGYVAAINITDWSMTLHRLKDEIPELSGYEITLGSILDVDGVVVLFGTATTGSGKPRQIFMATYNGSWRLAWLGAFYGYNAEVYSIPSVVINRSVLVVYQSSDASTLSYAVIDPLSVEVVDAGTIPDINLTAMIEDYTYTIRGVTYYGAFIPMLVKDPRHGFVIALIPHPPNHVYVSIYDPYSKTWSKPFRAFYVQRNIFTSNYDPAYYHYGSAYPVLIFENGDPYLVAAIMTEMRDATYIHVLTANIDYTYPILVLPTPALSPTTLPPPQPWTSPLMLVLFIVMLALGVGGLVYILARR